MKTCFACDKQFEHHIESSTISPDYCSVECQEEFEQGIAAEIESAKTSGLIDANGTAIISSSSPLTEEGIKKIVSQFSTRIPNA